MTYPDASLSVSADSRLAAAVGRAMPFGTEDWEKNLLQQFLASLYEEALRREIDVHLAQHGGKGSGNRKNGSAVRTLKTSVGKIVIHLPRDREGSYQPVMVTKWVKETVETEWRLITMYTSGGGLDAISRMLRSIYGTVYPPRLFTSFALEYEKGIREWQNRTLRPEYIYLSAVPVSVTAVEKGRTINAHHVYAFLALDSLGRSDVLGLWRNDSESRENWLRVLDNLKSRGVEDILFFSMKQLPGLVESVSSVFPRTLVRPRTESAGQMPD